MAKRSRIADELEKHEEQARASEEREALEASGNKRRGSGRVRNYLKDQLVKRTSTKR